MSVPGSEILRRLIEPGPKVRSRHDRLQARTVAALALALPFASVVAAAIQVWIRPTLWDDALWLLPWALLNLIAWFLAKDGRQAAAASLIVALPVAATAMAIFRTPSDAVLFLYFLVPVTVAGALLDGPRKVVVVVCVLAVASAMGAYALPFLGAEVALQGAIAFLFLVVVWMAAQAHLIAVETERGRDLAAREALSRRLLEASFGGLAVVRDGVIEEANDGFGTLFGAGVDAVVGRPVGEFLPDLHLDGGIDASTPAEAAGRRADGSFVRVAMVARPDSSPDGLAHVVAVQDLSDRDAFRARLHQADRMAAMGQIAAGVAHEINNPLTWVVGNLERLLGTGIDGEMRVAVEQAAEGARRVRRIARDLNTFARARQGPTVGVDLARVVRSAVNMVRHDMALHAQIDEEYGDAPTIDADPTRVGQVCLNLLVNASHAVTDGGSRVRVEVGTDPSGQAFLAVEDDGPGIPEGLRGRVFEPFFSTKADGTGLGLAISRGLVEDMGGEMFLEGRTPKGTRIGFRVPPGVLPRQPTGDDDTAEVEKAESARARVLIIDDEPTIGDLLKTALSDHDVTVAQSGHEGRTRALEQAWDVILCDLMMPGVSGMDIHAALAHEAPGRERRMVFLTGGAFTEESRTFLDRAQNPVMFKPFRLSKVRDLVAQTLADAK